jgi:hypothetical protein
MLVTSRHSTSFAAVWCATLFPQYDVLSELRHIVASDTLMTSHSGDITWIRTESRVCENWCNLTKKRFQKHLSDDF